uniref:Toll-like recptor 3 n=1 Tax=Oncomelania hupensis TaxID=56141 RepID=A0A2H4HHW9_9CAEN|nr:toll-like recptor 3 [Oncomelania hupensis]
MAYLLVLCLVVLQWRTARPGIIPFTPMVSIYYVCGPCKCSSSGLDVDCSSRNLTSVPIADLPASTTTINLSNNSISTLPPGAFAKFPNLHTLDLSQNLLGKGNSSLDGDIFHGIEHLQQLNLAANDLDLRASESEFPSAPTTRPFVLLPSLQQLDLSVNKLDAVPSDLFQGLNGSLKSLDLSHNQLGQTHQTFLPNFPRNLLHLDLFHNALTGFQKQAFSGLHHLEWLNLRHNHIPPSTKAYPPGLFDPFGESLIELQIQGNCDSKCSFKHRFYPDTTFAKLTALETLYMDGFYPDLAFGPGFQNMTSLVKLSLSSIDGAFCNLEHIPNNTFQNIWKGLRNLNLSGCAISHIGENAFYPLRNLLSLDVSNNINLSFDRFGAAVYGLQNSSLRELHINAITHPYALCVVLTPENTKYFRNTVIETIHARTNRIEVFTEKALENMPKTLKKVHVDENLLGFGLYFKDLGQLENLREVYNDGFQIALTPPTSYPPQYTQRCRVQVKSEEEDFSSQQHSYYRSDVESREMESSDVNMTFILPPNLDTYVSRWNKLYYKLLTVHFNHNNSLRVLDLSNNLLATWIGPIDGLHSLEVLDLSNNFAYNVSLHFFDTFTSLKLFNGSRNSLRERIQSDVEGKLFSPLKDLEHLDLSKNSINLLPKKAFHGLNNMQTLRLAYNEIFTLDVNLTHMANLTMLDLAYNHISTLPQSIMDHLDSVAERHSAVYVNMTKNPIACTCKYISFLTWIQQSKVLFIPKTNLPCLRSDGDINTDSDIMVTIDQLKKQCAANNAGMLIGAASCFFCLMVALVSALLYRFRWELRYLYYASRLAYHRLESDHHNFTYDAFVSYSSEDERFVRGELVSELETRAGLRLNVHNRDFIPGRPIPSNIVEAVQNSRRTLVVLTRDLLLSNWCHYEMQMATMEAAYTGRDVLLFLVYESIPSDQMSKDVLYNLQTSTYIEYPQNGDAQLLRDFWKRLSQAIKE